MAVAPTPGPLRDRKSAARRTVPRRPGLDLAAARRRLNAFPGLLTGLSEEERARAVDASSDEVAGTPGKARR